MSRAALLVSVVGAALGAVAPAGAAYQPEFSFVLSESGPAAAPAVTATVTQAPGESANRRVAVRYPPQFGFNPGFTVTGCAPRDEGAGACPETSRIGTSRAVTGLSTFSGPVYITEDFRLLSYLRAPGDLLEQRVEGKLYLHSDGSIETVFDDLPDFPTTLAETAIEGGSRGILLTPRQCGHYSVTSDLTSHSGERVTSDVPIEISGCPKRPAISRLRARPRRFRTRTRLGWRLSQPASHTAVSVQRLEGPRWRELRKLAGPGHLGENALSIDGRRLRPGRYRFVLRALSREGLASRSVGVRAIRLAAAKR